MRLSAKLLLISGAVLLVAVLAVVVPVWDAMRRQVVANMQNELKGIAATAALQLDGDLHRQVRTLDDGDGAAFLSLRSRLAMVQAANGIDLRHIYTFYPDGEDLLRFAVMLNPPDELFIGDPYPVRPEMRPTLEDGVVAATDLYMDDHGAWISAYAPIRDGSGAIVGILEVDKSSEHYFQRFHAITWMAGLMGLTALAVSSALGWLVLQRLVIGPVNRIRAGMLALGRRDFTHRVELHTNDELEELGTTLNRISGDLDVARLVQERLLPRRLPQCPGYRLAARSIPCDATGGDYYDVFRLPGDRTAVLVADVSGHGLGASLLMASCRSAVRTLSAVETSPAALLERVNGLLAEELEGGRFITLVFGVLDGAGRFTFSNYGHGPALAVCGGAVRTLESHRPPVGVLIDLPEADGQTTIALAPGDRVFLASDGLTEAMNDDGAMLGPDPVHRIVADPALTMDAVIARLHEILVRHCGGPNTRDDVTMVCVERKGATPEA